MNEEIINKLKMMAREAGLDQEDFNPYDYSGDNYGDIHLARWIMNKRFEKLSTELCSVQPMPGDLFKELIDNSLPEEELIEQGYEPVCPYTRLMWVKR